MLQLIGVLVPVVVAIVSTFRWPTLERRIRRHLSLLKEVPEGMGLPLRDLVKAELADLAGRDRERLDSQEDRLLFALRLALFVPMASLLVVSWLSEDAVQDRGFPWGRLFAMYGVVLLWWIVLGLIWAGSRPIARRFLDFYRRHTSSRRPESNRSRRRDAPR